MALHDSKVLKLIQALDNTEKRRFRKYLRSPALVSRGDLITAFKFLDANCKSILKQTVREEDLHTDLFGQKPYSLPTIRRIQNLLVEAIRAFWHFERSFSPANQEIESRIAVERGIEVMETMSKKGLNQMFILEAESTHKKLLTLPKDSSFHLLRSRILEVEAAHKSRVEYGKPRLELPLAQLEISQFHLLETLRYEAAILNQGKIAGNQPAGIGSEELEKWYARLGSKNQFAEMQLQFIKLLKTEDMQVWKTLHQMLQEHGNELPAKMRKEFYLLLLNSALIQLNRGHSNFHDEVWMVYQFLLGEGLLESSEGFPREHFENLISLAAFRSDFEFIEEFYLEHEGKLQKTDRPLTGEFCRGIISLSKGDLVAAKKSFLEVFNQSKDFVHEFVSILNLMKIKFLEGDWNDIIDYDYQKVRMRIDRRKQKTGLPLEKYRDFNHYLKQLSRLKIRNAPQADFDQLKKEMMGRPKIVNKAWLLDQF